MMSRSVWHKLRESKLVSLDGLQLSDMLQGLQPAGKPIPGRMSILHSLSLDEKAEDLSPGGKEGNGSGEGDPPSTGEADKRC
jgi:hypothetical protein